MTTFQPKKSNQSDCFMTPKSAWQAISHLIPKDKQIWEPFYGSGESGKFLEELGFEVVHNNNDFFENDEGEIIVTNPPFSKSKEVINRLKKLGKPFILLMPCAKVITSYFRENFKDTENHLQIIIPRKRIHFMKHTDGKPVEGWKLQTAFDCFYYAWKMNLPRDILWLE